MAGLGAPLNSFAESALYVKFRNLMSCRLQSKDSFRFFPSTQLPTRRNRTLVRISQTQPHIRTQEAHSCSWMTLRLMESYTGQGDKMPSITC